MRRRQVGPGGVPHARLPIVEDDQEERAERHDLPGQQEEQPVARGDRPDAIAAVSRFRWNQLAADARARGLAAGQVAAAVNPGHDRKPEDRKQKKRRQRIDFEMDATARHERGRQQRLRLSRNQHANGAGQPDSATADRACLSGQPTRTGAGAERGRSRAAQHQQQDRDEELGHRERLPPFESDAAAARWADRTLGNQLDACGIKGADQFH